MNISRDTMIEMHDKLIEIWLREKDLFLSNPAEFDRFDALSEKLNPNSDTAAKNLDDALNAFVGAVMLLTTLKYENMTYNQRILAKMATTCTCTRERNEVTGRIWYTPSKSCPMHGRQA